MRDKNRIRPFCEKLAELWEQKPDLRFGQIISLLPRYKEKACDLFYLEEDEMMGVIQQFFSSKGKKADKSDEDKRSKFEIKWQELMEELQSCNEFNTSSFKKLFADTWQYLIDSASVSYGIEPRNIPIISCISAFCWSTDYPPNTSEWGFNACIRVAEALINGLSSPLSGGYRGNFCDGYITVTEFHGAWHELHISEFDEYFDELAEIYRNNSDDCD